MGFGTVLGEVARQDVNKLNADISRFNQDLYNVVAAILPVLIITSYDSHWFPVKQLHQLSDGLCLMFIT